VGRAFINASTYLGLSRQALTEKKNHLIQFSTHQVNHELGRLCDDCSLFLGGASLFIAIAKSNAQSVKETSAQFQRIVMDNLAWMAKQSK
jgi:hypothetical protein